MRPGLRSHTLWIAAAALLLAATSTPASWYIGASIGDAEFDLEQDDFNDGSLLSGDIDDSDDGQKAYFGWVFNRLFGVEGGYVDLNNDSDGETTFSGQSNGTGPLYAAGPVSVDLEPKALYAMATVTLYRGRLWNVYGKAGYTYWEADVTTIDSNGTVEKEEDGSDVAFGLGAEVVLYKVLWLRAEWERFTDIVKDDVELISAGLVFRFGR
jgi:hypothetical protein